MNMVTSGDSTPSQPCLRILHHWACSGGTLIGKCVAALPDVLFLNEIHPLAQLRHQSIDPKQYMPSDIIHHLSMQHNGRDPVLILATFCEALEGLLRKAEPLGRMVVLRSHDHIDFFTGAIAASRSTIPEAMHGRALLLRQLTVRHPLDCWISLQTADWSNHLCFADLEEFCRRSLIMLDVMAAVPCLRYEQFVLDPLGGLQEISANLHLPFDPAALQRFNDIQISGDSGRGSGQIEPRPRRPLPDGLDSEVRDSQSYERLCARLGYDQDPGAEFPYLSSIVTEREQS